MPANSDIALKTIVDFSRRKGFVYPSSEIYGGYAATYDFGPLGMLLKKNLIDAWRYWMVQSRTDVVEIEGAIFLHPKVWEASGHIGGFSDLLVEDTVTHKRYRADHLIEDAGIFQNLNTLSEKEVNEIESRIVSEGYEPAVDCIIFNDKGQILSQKRSPDRRLYPNCWDFPGGHVDIGDSVYNTIFKEIKEELNLDIDKIITLADEVKWIVPNRSLRPGENPNKVILQFIVTVKSFEGMRLEEGKSVEFGWIDMGNIERLKEGRDNDFYIYESVKFLLQNYRVKENEFQKLIIDGGSLTAQEIDDIIEKNNIKSPDGNSLSKAKKFNLLVKTHLGPVENESSVAYLKGESCQNIYVDWKQVQETTRRKLPFGIAQLGKAFRNEITVKQFLFRTREFEQIDLQYFVKPPEFVSSDDGEMDHNNWYDYWKQQRWDFYTKYLGYNESNLSWRQHTEEERVFYAADAWDINYNFGQVGFKEMEGLHNRTDYDTKQHQNFSGQDLTYLDPKTNSRYLPYIIETSLGINRLFLSCLFEFYREENLQNDKGQSEVRVVMRFPYNLAPFKIAILPLMKKDGLAQKAMDLYSNLRKMGLSADYDETGSIGKRYRRQDENGTPWCLTIDYQTMEDNTVTIRHRDTMEQKRIDIKDVNSYLSLESFNI